MATVAHVARVHAYPQYYHRDHTGLQKMTFIFLFRGWPVSFDTYTPKSFLQLDSRLIVPSAWSDSMLIPGLGAPTSNTNRRDYRTMCCVSGSVDKTTRTIVLF